MTAARRFVGLLRDVHCTQVATPRGVFFSSLAIRWLKSTHGEKWHFGLKGTCWGTGCRSGSCDWLRFEFQPAEEQCVGDYSIKVIQRLITPEKSNLVTTLTTLFHKITK